MDSFGGSDLEVVRRRFGRTQADMARSFGVTRQTWLAWERAETLPVVLRLALSAWLHDLAPYGAGEGRGADVARPKRAAPKSAFKAGYDPRRAKK